MRLQVSEGAWPPKRRLAGSQGWCSGSCTSQRGGRKALLIPWEKARWQTEQSECLPSAPPPRGGGMDSTHARVFWAGLHASVFCSQPQGDVGWDTNWACRVGKED